MSKELEALEALKRIKRHCLKDQSKKVSKTYYCHNELDLIENALKDYENLQLKHRSMTEQVFNDFKKLKALKIIKEKSVDVGFLQYSSSVDLYNHYIVEHAWTKHTKILTPEEFDLLKKVLL